MRPSASTIPAIASATTPDATTRMRGALRPRSPAIRHRGRSRPASPARSTAIRRHRPSQSPAGASTSATTTRSQKIARARRCRPPPARLRPRSRSGFRGQTAEPAFPPGVFGDRPFQRGLVEIRPVDRHEHQFAVGRLPHQEIRQPLLAAGADDQIGIGNIGRVEISAERIGIDRRRIALALRDLARQPLRRVGDFLARAVIEGDDEVELGVGPGQFFGLVRAARRYRARARRARRSRAPGRRRDAASPDRCG